MKFCRFFHDGHARFGRLERAEVLTLSSAPWHGGEPTGERHALSDVQLLVPAPATKVVCVGQNYRAHALEMGKPIPEQPLIFIKPSTALNPTGQPILLPSESNEVHHEAELGLVIGRRLKKASLAEALDGIFGLTCVNDVTARDIQKKEIQHTRAKGFDTFACVGPWIVDRGTLDPADLQVTCRVNGEVRQDGRTSDMIFDVARLVSFISQGMTLLPGDVVSTGTPSGVGRISAGDTVEVEIEGIGTLSNPVLPDA